MMDVANLLLDDDDRRRQLVNRSKTQQESTSNDNNIFHPNYSYEHVPYWYHPLLYLCISIIR